MSVFEKRPIIFLIGGYIKKNFSQSTSVDKKVVQKLCESKKRNFYNINRQFSFILSSSTVTYDDTKAHLKKLVRNIELSKMISSGIGATVAIAAAGFGAASWGFGITTPFAIACTAISTTVSIISFILERIIDEYDIGRPEWIKSFAKVADMMNTGCSIADAARVMIPKIGELAVLEGAFAVVEPLVSSLNFAASAAEYFSLKINKK